MRLSELVVLLLALSTLTFAKKTSRFQKRRFPKATLQPRDDGDGEDDGPFCLNGLKPSKPVGQPGLCPQFVTSSCCLPYEDADYADQYDNYLSLGKGCTQTYTAPNAIYLPFKLYFCASCDPNSPSYRDDDAMTFRICKSLTDQLWGEDGKKYDSCGINYPGACGVTIGNDTYPIEGDPFDCGDDLVVPSTVAADAEEFMNGNDDFDGFKVPGLEDYTMVIVEDEEGNCYNGKYSSSSILAPFGSLIIFSTLLFTILFL